jgi:hypothetical protein
MGTIQLNVEMGGGTFLGKLGHGILAKILAKILATFLAEILAKLSRDATARKGGFSTNGLPWPR